MHSAIYEGTVRHRRYAEHPHVLQHRLALTYLDLDEIDRVLDGALVRPGPGLIRFRRRDHLGDPGTPLADAVRSLVAERLGHAPRGPVRLLTHLRTLGHCFNPVSFYYCYAAGGHALDAIVAEVTSTPWGERHAYVLPCDGRPDGKVLGGWFDKALHVSPFMDMDQQYEWRASTPGQTLWVHMTSLEGGRRVFDATLRLQRRPLDRRRLLWTTARYPVPTVRVLGLIYAHAVVLWLKGVRIRPHPEGGS